MGRFEGLEIDAFQVGLVHPVQLTPGLRSAWAARLADYELIQPFPQLTRPVYDLTEETVVTEVTGFNFQSASGFPFNRMLRAAGWNRRYEEAARVFPTAGVTALVKWHGWDRVSFEGCRFIYGALGITGYQNATPLPLGQVDPIVRCETFADLERWARAAGVVPTAGRITG